MEIELKEREEKERKKQEYRERIARKNCKITFLYNNIFPKKTQTSKKLTKPKKELTLLSDVQSSPTNSTTRYGLWEKPTVFQNMDLTHFLPKVQALFILHQMKNFTNFLIRKNGKQEKVKEDLCTLGKSMNIIIIVILKKMIFLVYRKNGKK